MLLSKPKHEWIISHLFSSFSSLVNVYFIFVLFFIRFFVHLVLGFSVRLRVRTSRGCLYYSRKENKKRTKRTSVVAGGYHPLPVALAGCSPVFISLQVIILHACVCITHIHLHSYVQFLSRVARQAFGFVFQSGEAVWSDRYFPRVTVRAHFFIFLRLLFISFFLHLTCALCVSYDVRMCFWYLYSSPQDQENSPIPHFVFLTR